MKYLGSSMRVCFLHDNGVTNHLRIFSNFSRDIKNEELGICICSLQLSRKLIAFIYIVVRNCCLQIWIFINLEIMLLLHFSIKCYVFLFLCFGWYLEHQLSLMGRLAYHIFYFPFCFPSMLFSITPGFFASLHFWQSLSDCKQIT